MASLKAQGFDISESVNVVDKYNKIMDKCIKKVPAIINIQDVCKADEKIFSDMKSCVMGQIMDVVTRLPMSLMKAEQGCQAAKKINLVEKVVLPAITDEHVTQD